MVGRARAGREKVVVLDDGQHAACVTGWLDQSGKGLSAPALRRLLETGLGALWTRTKTTIGEVTLTAIGERVLYTATETFPFFAAFKVDPSRGFEFRGAEGETLAPKPVLKEGIRFLLVEFLTVLGNLTADILTPELHAELMRVVPSQGVHLVKGPDGPPDQPKRLTGEGAE